MPGICEVVQKKARHCAAGRPSPWINETLLPWQSYHLLAYTFLHFTMRLSRDKKRKLKVVMDQYMSTYLPSVGYHKYPLPAFEIFGGAAHICVIQTLGEFVSIASLSPTLFTLL